MIVSKALDDNVARNPILLDGCYTKEAAVLVWDHSADLDGTTVLSVALQLSEVGVEILRSGVSAILGFWTGWDGRLRGGGRGQVAWHGLQDRELVGLSGSGGVNVDRASGAVAVEAIPDCVRCGEYD